MYCLLGNIGEIIESWVANGMIQNRKGQLINEKRWGVGEIVAEMSLNRPDRMGCGNVAL